MEPDFEAAQVRLQVRHARLPDEATWVRMAAVRGLPAYLESARATVLGPWVGGLGADSGAHVIDATCRRLLLEAIDEVAGWVPAPWTEAVRWSRWVPHLAEIEAWLGGGLAPRWRDQASGPGVLLVPEEGTRAREVAGEGAVFAQAFRAGEPLLATWARAWRARWPEARAESVEALEGLGRLVARHAERFPGLTVREAWPARRTLREALRYRFRRVAGSPAAAFAYLLMLALDLEHLRADLTRRALFPLPEAA